MQYGNVPGVDKQISRLVQGIIQVNSKDEAEGFALLDAVWEQNINAFDTARVYGDKDAFLGKWLNARGLRDEAVVIAKGAHHSGLRKRVTPYDIGSDLHDTLAAMQTSYVDVFMLHRDDPEYPVEPIVDALNHFHKEGKIKAFGGSNWTTERIQAANDYAQKNGLIGFACSSPNFSLAEQLKEPWGGCVTISGVKGEAERRWYRERNFPLFTWSSMAGGFLSGRYRRDNLDTFAEGLDKLAVDCYASEENFQRLDRLQELGAAKGLTVPQMAVAYILSYPLNIFALVGAAAPDEAKANVQAMETKLTEAEMAYLDLRADAPT